MATQWTPPATGPRKEHQSRRRHRAEGKSSGTRQVGLPACSCLCVQPSYGWCRWECSGYPHCSLALEYLDWTLLCGSQLKCVCACMSDYLCGCVWVCVGVFMFVYFWEGWNGLMMLMEAEIMLYCIAMTIGQGLFLGTFGTSTAAKRQLSASSGRIFMYSIDCDTV